MHNSFSAFDNKCATKIQLFTVLILSYTYLQWTQKYQLVYTNIYFVNLTNNSMWHFKKLVHFLKMLYCTEYCKLILLSMHNFYQKLYFYLHEVCVSLIKCRCTSLYIISIFINAYQWQLTSNVLNLGGRAAFLLKSTFSINKQSNIVYSTTKQ